MAEVAEYIKKRWGTPTRVIERTINLGPSVLRLLDNNPRRFCYSVTNLGASPIFLGFSSNVSLSSGLYITGDGGTLIVTAEEDGELSTYELWGIRGGADANVYIVEVIGP